MKEVQLKMSEEIKDIFTQNNIKPEISPKVVAILSMNEATDPEMIKQQLINQNEGGDKAMDVEESKLQAYTVGGRGTLAAKKLSLIKISEHTRRLVMSKAVS